jgi:hypothetical protein
LLKLYQLWLLGAVLGGLVCLFDMSHTLLSTSFLTDLIKCCSLFPLWVHFTMVSSAPSVTPPVTPSSHPTIIQQLSVHTIVSSTTILLTVILFSLPSSPEFHRIVHFYKHVMCKFVYDHVSFCVYVFFLDLSCTYEPLSFWTWLTSLDMMSSSCVHLPSNHMVPVFLWL